MHSAPLRAAGGAIACAMALAAADPSRAQIGACCEFDDGQGGIVSCEVTDAATCLTANGTFLGEGTDCTDCSIENCGETDANCQHPNIGEFPGGTILTPGTLPDDLDADNFVATFTGNITSVCFWGAYIDAIARADCDDPLPTDDVTIRFYFNRPSLPPFPDENTPIVFEIDAADLTRRVTGQPFTLQDFDEPVSEYEWTADLGIGMPVQAGECYWISIANTPASANPDCEWYWEVSPEITLDPLGDGDALSIPLGALPGPPDPPGGIGFVSANPFDLAWCIGSGTLTDTLGDPLQCYQPINEACGDPLADPPQLPCNVPNPGVPGCLDADCCTLVCDGNADKFPDFTGIPTCCDIEWSDACVDAAVVQVGCVAQPVCGSLAEEDQPLLCQVFETTNAWDSTTDSTGASGDTGIVADDFSFDLPATVTTVCWQGISTTTDPDDFTIRFYDDNDGLPGTVLATYTGLTEASGFLAKLDTNLNFAGTPLPVFEYTVDLSAVSAPMNFDADTCYWIEITNDIGADGDLWGWSEARDDVGGNVYDGNGRVAIDGRDVEAGIETLPDGWDFKDKTAGIDVAFCFPDLSAQGAGPLPALRKPACGLELLYNTGPEVAVLFDPTNQGNFGDPTFLGYSAGCLDSDSDGNCLDDEFPQRRAAHPFELPTVSGPGPVQSWTVDIVLAYGFTPDGIDNEQLVFEVYRRDGATGTERPVNPDDALISGVVSYEAAVSATDHPQQVLPNVGSNDGAHAIFQSFDLPPGPYWLAVYADNAGDGNLKPPANFGWFYNAKSGLIIGCQAEPWPNPTPEDNGDLRVVGCFDSDPEWELGGAYFWRSRYLPDGASGDPLPDDGYGYGSFSYNSTTLALDADDPDPDPQKLYSASFQLLGRRGGFCGNGVIDGSEACDDGNTAPGDGCNEICQEEPAGPKCPYDCQVDDIGDPNPDGAVGINDFLTLLAQWQQAGATCDVDPDDVGAGINDFLALLAAWGPCPK